MGTLSYTVPTAGTDLNSVADPEIATALTTLKTWGNGNIDPINLSATTAQSACVNQSGQTVKGVANIATSQSTSSTTFTTLATPDQVTGIVLPTNGLIAVAFQGMWQNSVASAGQAAIFIGANQLKVQGWDNSTGHQPLPQFAVNPQTALNQPLFTFAAGLGSGTSSTGFTGDVTTGQVVGYFNASGGQIGAGVGTLASNLFNFSGTSASVAAVGGPCYVFAAAGTYTVSVQFKASSGSVTVANRQLWVQAVSFS